MTRETIHVPHDAFSAPNIDGLVLYRCFGLDGTLMYIGQTHDLHVRIQQHRKQEPWWCAVERLEVQRYRNRKVLRQDEWRAIYFEQPHFNKYGKLWPHRSLLGLGGRAGKPIWGGNDEFAPVEHAENCTCLYCYSKAATMVGAPVFPKSGWL